jgi:hypothetical protein
MVMAYEQFPEAYFVTTKGFANKNKILPIMTDLGYNNFPCRHWQVFHSAFGFRLDKFPFRYIKLDLNNEIIYPAADGDMLDQISKSCTKNGYKTIGVPMITCFHDSERGVSTKF